MATARLGTTSRFSCCASRSADSLGGAVPSPLGRRRSAGRRRDRGSLRRVLPAGLEGLLHLLSRRAAAGRAPTRWRPGGRLAAAGGRRHPGCRDAVLLEAGLELLERGLVERLGGRRGRGPTSAAGDGQSGRDGGGGREHEPPHRTPPAGTAASASAASPAPRT